MRSCKVRGPNDRFGGGHPCHRLEFKSPDCGHLLSALDLRRFCPYRSDADHQVSNRDKLNTTEEDTPSEFGTASLQTRDRLDIKKGIKTPVNREIEGPGCCGSAGNRQSVG